MSQTWWTSQYLQTIIDHITPEFHTRGLSELLRQVRQAVDRNDIVLARSIEQRAFTELHTGPWDQVWHRWRTLYTLSLLVQIRYRPKSQQHLLEMIDRALIFGDDLCREQLTAYAEELSNDLADKFDNEPIFVDDRIGRDASYDGVNRSLARPVVRLRNCDPFRFHREFVSSGTPVILEGMINSWPSLNERSFKNMTYLKKKMGFRTVLIESGRDYQNDPDWHPVHMTVNEFIDSCILANQPMQSSILYLAQNDLFDQVPELAADISVPDYIDFDPVLFVDNDLDMEMTRPEVRTTVWFGPAGTLSPLHTDPENNLLCQVFGHKYVRLYQDSSNFRYQQEIGDISSFDYFEGVLNPGDALFIPKAMWHRVESLSTSFSVNFWWWTVSSYNV